MEAAVALLVLPPLLALLFEPSAPVTDVAGAAFVIALYTLVVGVIVHLGADLTSAWLRARGITQPLARLLLVEAVVASVVTMITLFLLPYLSALCTSIAESPITLLIRGLVVATVYVAVVFAWGQLRERFRAAERDAAERRERARIAELRAEQSRTNPHFFRNTLGMIAELIHEDPDQAEATLLRLGELFRYALEGYERPFVPLRDEVTALEAYLAIQHERHGGQVVGRLSIPEHLLSIPVPPLILQPLVENAIHHGFGRGAVSIAVQAAEDDDDIVVIVEDDGRLSPRRQRGTGTGLASVRERLHLAYGDRASLYAAPKSEQEGFVCTLRIPCAS